MSAEWGEYGPAEFDRRRMPRGHKRPDAGQAGLFVMAVTPAEPKPKPATAGELPGQLDIFAAIGPDTDTDPAGSDCLEGQS